MIRIFDIQNGKIVPTEHCYNLKALNDIIEQYPENHMKVLSYVFYMTCPNPDLNPFFDIREHEKEEQILSQLEVTFSVEDESVIAAIEFCKKMYETPTYRAYMGIKSMLDRLADYMGSTQIQHGRDGNINSLVNAASKFEAIRISFKGAYKDLMEEQKGTARGGQDLAYDQKM